jgi:hypothetical protein
MTDRRLVQWPHLSRTGTEPVTARTALGIRLILAVIFVPVFLAGTALFWFWMTQVGPGDAPGVDSLCTLTVICGGLAVFSVIDLLVVLRRRREQSREQSRERGRSR